MVQKVSKQVITSLIPVQISLHRKFTAECASKRTVKIGLNTEVMKFGNLLFYRLPRPPDIQTLSMASVSKKFRSDYTTTVVRTDLTRIMGQRPT